MALTPRQAKRRAEHLRRETEDERLGRRYWEQWRRTTDAAGLPLRASALIFLIAILPLIVIVHTVGWLMFGGATRVIGVTRRVTRRSAKPS